MLRHRRTRLRVSDPQTFHCSLQGRRSRPFPADRYIRTSSVRASKVERSLSKSPEWFHPKSPPFRRTTAELSEHAAFRSKPGAGSLRQYQTETEYCSGSSSIG